MHWTENMQIDVKTAIGLVSAEKIRTTEIINLARRQLTKLKAFEKRIVRISEKPHLYRAKQEGPTL